MKNISLILTPQALASIEYIKKRKDIGNNSQVIRSALNFYHDYLQKEDAKTQNYSKVQRQKTNEPENSYMCINDFNGTVTDEFGNPDSQGLYCKYDTFEKVTPKKYIKVVDLINPLERLEGLLASDTKYRNTSKSEVDNFIKDGGVCDVISKNDD